MVAVAVKLKMILSVFIGSALSTRSNAGLLSQAVTPAAPPPTQRPGDDYRAMSFPCQTPACPCCDGAPRHMHRPSVCNWRMLKKSAVYFQLDSADYIGDVLSVSKQDANGWHYVPNSTDCGELILKFLVGTQHGVQRVGCVCVRAPSTTSHISCAYDLPAKGGKWFNLGLPCQVVLPVLTLMTRTRL